MKKIYSISILASIMLLMACGGSDDEAVVANEGTISISVDAKQPAIVSRAAVNTDDFTVTVSDADGAEIKRYAAASEIPATITLPVGSYIVEAQSPGKLTKKMSTPYYSGSTEASVLSGVNTDIVVDCKMLNSKMQIIPSAEFSALMSEWTLTIDDGGESVLVFDKNSSTYLVFWKFGDKVKELTLNITGRTVNGNTIRDTRIFSKGDANESYDGDAEYFSGGDAIVINLSLTESTAGNITGVTIDADIIFDETTEDIVVDVEWDKEDNEQGGEGNGDAETPGEDTPSADAPTVQLPEDVTYSVSGEGMPASADAYIAASKGLKDINVVIKSGNEAFAEILKDLAMDGQSFIDGVNLVDNSDFNNLLQTVDASLKSPSLGDKEYTFPIGVFFTFLNITGATDAGKAHEFIIKVTDCEGNTSSEYVYKITITE